MTAFTIPPGVRFVRRVLAGGLVLLIALLVGVAIARAGEIVPSVGLTRPVHGDETKTYVGLALRGNLVPVVQTEVAIALRGEDRFGDAGSVKLWPVTASLWLTPVPTLYAGAGVGWYHTTVESPLPGGSSSTDEQFGVHVGGGFKVPVAPAAAIDLGGRYVMMREQSARLVPERFDPDFWTLSAGLAVRF